MTTYWALRNDYQGEVHLIDDKLIIQPNITLADGEKAYATNVLEAYCSTNLNEYPYIKFDYLWKTVKGF